MAKQKGTTDAPSTNGAPTTKEAERLPAYFLSLTLENVRCFGPEQTLDLSDGTGKPARWTIILGLNGTGKTTLLQSLVGFEVVREGITSSATEPSWEVPRAVSWYRKLAFHAFHRDQIDASKLELRLINSNALDQLPVTEITCHLEFDRGGGASARNYQNTFRCYAYGAGRRLGSAALSESETDAAVATLFSDRAELRNPEEWLLQLDYAAVTAPKNRDAQHRFAQAKELLLAIMPEGEITDIRCVPGSGPNPKARAEFRTPYGWVPLRQLGYGYQTLITWVADLANRMAERYPDSKNPLAEPAVVLVDEIDLHLHPKWQRKLMGFLTNRFPNTQFIATAHSPLVAQAAADANLAVLRRKDDHVIIDNDVDYIRNWRIDQILTSDLFGLKTARPPHVEAKLLERETLLTKPKQTAADKKRLAALEAEIGELQMGESTKEIEDRTKMFQLLETLTKEQKNAS